MAGIERAKAEEAWNNTGEVGKSLFQELKGNLSMFIFNLLVLKFNNVASF